MHWLLHVFVVLLNLSPVSAAPPNAGSLPSAPLTPMFETVSAMRDAVGMTAERGTTSTQLNMAIFTNDAEKITEMFADDVGSVMCQGTAYYLHLRYLEAGYRSYLVGFENDDFSHAVALVQIRRSDGTNALIVEDPTFDISYADESGRPISIFEIMKRVHSGMPIQILYGKTPHPEYLAHAGDPIRSPYVDSLIGPSAHRPDTEIYSTTETLERFCKLIGYKSIDDIVRGIFSKPIYVYHRYPMTDLDKADADQLFAKLEDIYNDGKDALAKPALVTSD